MTAKVRTFGAIVLLLGCSRDPAATAPTANPAATAAHTVVGAKDAARSAHSSPNDPRAPKSKAQGKEQAESGFSVPFVWETSKDDPLAVARKHLQEMLADNASYVRSKSKPPPSKITSSARTTIVACSDAAVQLDALDATPENDTFVARNWGNLFEPSLGTITYGIEVLKTPVLLIVGHTGCEAVKAALVGERFSKPIQGHFGKLKVKDSGKATEIERVNDAVVQNVNRQVARAVQRFQSLVRTGMLTVIGGVYDATNALGRGQGRLSIINVNSVTDPVAMNAFVTAVTNDDKIVRAMAVEPPGSGAHSSSALAPAPAVPAPAVTTPRLELPRIDHLEPSLVGNGHTRLTRYVEEQLAGNDPD